MKLEKLPTASSLWGEFEQHGRSELLRQILRGIPDRSLYSRMTVKYEQVCMAAREFFNEAELVDLEFVAYSIGVPEFVHASFFGQTPVTRVPEIHTLADRLQPGQWAIACGVKNPAELRTVSWNTPEHHIIAAVPDVFLRVARGAVGTLRMMNPERNPHVVVIGGEWFCAAMNDVVGGSDFNFRSDDPNIHGISFDHPTYLVIENFSRNLIDVAVETSVHNPFVRLLTGMPQELCTPEFARGVVSPMRTIWTSGPSHSMLADEKGKYWWPLMPPEGSFV